MDKVTDKQHKKHIAQILETIELGCSGIVGDSDVAALKYILDLSAKQAKTIEELKGSPIRMTNEILVITNKLLKDKFTAQAERIKVLEAIEKGELKDYIELGEKHLRLQAEVAKLKEQITRADINLASECDKRYPELARLKAQIKLLSKRPDFSKPGHDVDKFYKFYKD